MIKGYTARQYAIILLKEDFNYSIREIAKRMGMSQSGVNYVLNNIRRK
jgi:DNA-directed RNA polymerase specialized sigma24 family protein